MIYPHDFEQKLGFDQVRQKIAAYCSSSAAKMLVDDLSFSTDFDAITISLQQNLEFKFILVKGETFPSQYFFDPTKWLQKIALEGSYLDEQDLLDLSNSILTILACKSFLNKSQEFYPQLFQLTKSVTISGQLGQLITSRIDDSAKVKDTASAALSKVRKRLREEQTRIRKLSEQIYRKAVEDKWVPDGALPTIRDGRIVIPILAEHKRRLRGFILDESATGQTVFSEPTELLDTNNAIRELEHAEKREVIKVLTYITDTLRQHLPDLSDAFQFLTRIDFIRSKAKLSVEIEADMPRFTKHPELTLYRAKHPLLFLSHKGKREVVPLEIDLDRDNAMLLVSGPNAGGKSVCLKTVGILQYMLQCGLLVPVSDRSRMGIFDDIFLDIGDQQSIENDLSTYSSHLRNMKTFIQHAGENSLVLMDELGSGTDPNFGGAIAEAGLHCLLDKKVWGVATTHYYNLKLFAEQHRGIRNAAMRFDDKNLKPLYVLDIGKPGSSFALEIAREIGLPEDVITEAEQLVGKELAGFETLVRNLDKEKQALSVKLMDMGVKEMDLNKQLEKYSTLSSELEGKKKEIIEKAKLEAQQLLRETNREIEKTIRHIRENKAEKKETKKVRQNLQGLSKKIIPDVKKIKKEEPLREGDRVRIVGQQGSGVLQLIKGKNGVVQFGDLKSVVSLEKLEKLTSSGQTQVPARKSSSGININDKRATFNETLDVRGKRVEEVAPLLDHFIDSAILLSQSEVRILHGKGEGVLRKVVRDQLKKYKDIASVRDEHVERGGDGITIVVLK